MVSRENIFDAPEKIQPRQEEPETVEAEESIIPEPLAEESAEALRAESDDDAVARWLRENRSGRALPKPERMRGGGASGMTDEAKDLT